MILYYLICVFILGTALGCSQGDEKRKGKKNGKEKTVEQLKQEVLSKAEACNETDKKEYEQKIAAVRLIKKEDKEFKKYLRTVRDKICP